MSEHRVRVIEGGISAYQRKARAANGAEGFYRTA